MKVEISIIKDEKTGKIIIDMEKEEVFVEGKKCDKKESRTIIYNFFKFLDDCTEN